MDKNFDIADCIVALIQGVATQEQVTRLDAWLEEADENRRLFASLLDEFAYEQRRKKLGQLKLNESFENVRKERNRRVRLRNIRRIAVAASVLLLVTVGGTWLGKGDRDTVGHFQPTTETGSQSSTLPQATNYRQLPRTRGIEHHPQPDKRRSISSITFLRRATTTTM